MGKINYGELTELKNWVEEFKLLFTDENVTANLQKIENILSDILEERKTQALTSSAAAVKSAPDAIDYESYKNEYLRLFEFISSTGISIADSIEYFELRNVISDATDKLSAAQDISKETFENIINEINEKGRIYKNSVYPVEQFSDTDIERIKAVNALLNLEIDIKSGTTSLDSCDGINRLLMVKTFQAVLADGLKSDPQLYKKDFFDHEKLFRAGKDAEVVKPFVQKYQKAVSMKDRKALLSRSDKEVVTVFCKALKQKPVQLLEYSKEYDDITKR